MEGYLNELSLRTYSNREEVKKTLMRLNQTIAKLKSLGVSTIRTDGSLDSHQFLDGISFLRLLKDEEVIDKDLKGVLLATFETLDPVDFVTDKHLILEMKVNGNSCKGLGWASEKLEDTVAISFPLSDWENSSYTVSITQLMENDEDELIEDTVSSSTRNIISEVQCEQHRFFLEKKRKMPGSGKALWAMKNVLFPNLKFCDSTKKQMQSLNIAELTQVYSNLLDLQRVAATCTGQSISPELFSSKTTIESDSRIKKHKNALMFLCPDNTKQLFSWHSRYTPGAGRIHFFPLEKKKLFYIGYIGEKIGK